MDDQTLVAGGAAVTISGTVISLISGGDSVVVGGKTEPISVVARTSTTVGLGGIIVSIGALVGSQMRLLRARARLRGPVQLQGSMGLCLQGVLRGGMGVCGLSLLSTFV